MYPDRKLMPKKLAISSALNHMPSTAFKDSQLSYHLLLTSCNLTFPLTTEQNAPSYNPKIPEHQIQKFFFIDLIPVAFF